MVKLSGGSRGSQWRVDGGQKSSLVRIDFPLVSLGKNKHSSHQPHFSYFNRHLSVPLPAHHAKGIAINHIFPTSIGICQCLSLPTMQRAQPQLPWSCQGEYSRLLAVHKLLGEITRATNNWDPWQTVGRAVNRDTNSVPWNPEKAVVQYYLGEMGSMQSIAYWHFLF